VRHEPFRRLAICARVGQAALTANARRLWAASGVSGAVTRPTISSALAPLVAAALALGIFIFDTLSPLQFAVAVLYVVVVLIAATYLQRRSVLIAATACGALTVLSYLLAHGPRLEGTAPDRSIISLAAIGITTMLALRTLAANARLREVERQRVNLARFFSPQLVEQLVQIDTPLLVARYQPAAVLFVDMIGFTAYCSKMAPDAVIAMLRDLLVLLSESVFSHDGTIDKFLGDGLMAVFGPPIPSPADATNAGRCALDIVQSIDRGTNGAFDPATRRSGLPSASTMAMWSRAISAATSGWSSRSSATRSILRAASRRIADRLMPRCWSPARSSMRFIRKAATPSPGNSRTRATTSCAAGQSRFISTA